MAYRILFSVQFKKDYDSLDKSMQIIVDKKLERILEKPTLSKPLEHSSGYYSERAKNLRIVFQIVGNEIWLMRVRERKKAYS